MLKYRFILYLKVVEKMVRKAFTTTIDLELQNKFKKFCLENDTKMNIVLEAFMEAYMTGEFQVQKRVSFELKKAVE